MAASIAIDAQADAIIGGRPCCRCTILAWVAIRACSASALNFAVCSTPTIITRARVGVDAVVARTPVAAGYAHALVNIHAAISTTPPSVAQTSVLVNSVDARTVPTAILSDAIVGVYLAVRPLVSNITVTRVAVVPVDTAPMTTAVFAYTFVNISLATWTCPPWHAGARVSVDAVFARTFVVAVFACAVINIAGASKAVPTIVAGADVVTAAAAMAGTFVSNARVHDGRRRGSSGSFHAEVCRGTAASAHDGLRVAAQYFQFFGTRIWNAVILVEIIVFNSGTACDTRVGDCCRPKGG